MNEHLKNYTNLNLEKLTLPELIELMYKVVTEIEDRCMEYS